jgi:gliding motility-associated-like protein
MTGQALWAQNLVPNPNFTQWDSCPYNKGQIYMAPTWESPNGRTTDFCHRCGQGGFAGVPDNQWGTQEPKVGDGYAGIRLWLDSNALENPETYREYLTTRLLDSMRAGEKYYVSFWVSIGEISAYSVDKLGLAFGQGTIRGGDVIARTPAIANAEGYGLRNKVGWEQIWGIYEAEGGEDALVIGNFFPDSDLRLIRESTDPDLEPTVYAYIDQVEVEPCASRLPDSLIAWTDLSLCEGGSLTLGSSLSAAEVDKWTWSDGSTDFSRQIDQPGWYTVEATVNRCPITDSVEILPALPVNLSLTGDTTLCPNQAVTLAVLDEGVNWRWQDKAIAPRRSLREPGLYVLTSEIPDCARVDSFRVQIQAFPQFPPQTDTIICRGSEWLIAIKVPNATFLWSDGSTDSTQVIREQGLYTVQIETGCYLDILQFAVNTLNCGCETFIPNVFTPNDDTFYDDFRFQMQPGARFLQLQIRDRYGRLCYEQSEPEAFWEGTFAGRPASEGVYYYSLEYQCWAGNGWQQRSRSGSLTLIR